MTVQVASSCHLFCSLSYKIVLSVLRTNTASNHRSGKKSQEWYSTMLPPTANVSSNSSNSYCGKGERERERERERYRRVGITGRMGKWWKERRGQMGGRVGRTGWRETPGIGWAEMGEMHGTRNREKGWQKVSPGDKVEFKNESFERLPSHLILVQNVALVLLIPTLVEALLSCQVTTIDMLQTRSSSYLHSRD